MESTSENLKKLTNETTTRILKSSTAESTSENLKRRKVPMTPEEEEEFLTELLTPREGEESDSDDELLPYGGRAYLARKNKPDSWACIAFQVFLIVFAIAMVIYAVYFFEHMHVNVLTAYAHLGYDTAQHELANRYLHGRASFNIRSFEITSLFFFYI